MSNFKNLKGLSCSAVMRGLGLGAEASVAQQLAKVLIDNSVLASNQVFYSCVGHASLIIDARDGAVYKYDNSRFETKIADGCIFVKHYDLQEWCAVYCGADDVFDFTEVSVTDGYTTAGGLDYPALALSDIEIGKCKLRVHTIVYGVVFGYEVLKAIGEEGVRTHDIHHIRGLLAGNGIENLQLLTISEHRELEAWLRKNIRGR